MSANITIAEIAAASASASLAAFVLAAREERLWRSPDGLVITPHGTLPPAEGGQRLALVLGEGSVVLTELYRTGPGGPDFRAPSAVAREAARGLAARCAQVICGGERVRASDEEADALYAAPMAAYRPPALSAAEVEALVASYRRSHGTRAIDPRGTGYPWVVTPATDETLRRDLVAVVSEGVSQGDHRSLALAAVVLAALVSRPIPPACSAVVALDHIAASSGDRAVVSAAAAYPGVEVEATALAAELAA